MEATDVLARLQRRNPRYAECAYLFLLASLRRCMEQLEEPRHVTGAEVAAAACDLALERYGPLARTVLEHWGIHSTEDLGEIVFLLVECGILIKRPSDTRADFEGLFSFEEVFEESYPWGSLGGERRA